MTDFQKSTTIARHWWKKLYRNHRDYLVGSDPFKKSEARRTEWEAIYQGFNITPARYSRLIDFGCGGGHFALNFLKKGFEVTGIDVLKVALDIVRERTRKYNLSKKLHLVRSGLHAPVKALKGRFDAGYMIVTYHCIPKEEQRRIFSNFVRLIRKGGKILIMEPNPLNPLFYLFYIFYYKGKNLQEGLNIINSRKDLLIRLFKEAGLTDITVFRHSFFPTSYINRWGFIRNVNRFLCSIPVVNNFCAFHIITGVK